MTSSLGMIWLITLVLATFSLMIPAWEHFELRELSRRHRFSAALAIARLGAAVICVFSVGDLAGFASALAVLVLSYALSLLWGGAYNGGSDSMLLLTWLGICAGMFSPEWQGFGLAWIAVQVTASYFLSGISKFRVSSEWRSGVALRLLLQSPRYLTLKHRVFFRAIPEKILRLLCWLVLGWEVLFPLVWMGRGIAVVFLGVGVLFHFGNSMIFGLNRFFWTWVVAYPAIVFWVGKLHSSG